MSGIFAHGWALPWLAAAALPLVLYLIYRWRRRKVRWGAMRFLLAARSQTRRRVEFQQVILIALRTLLVVLVVLAFARPSLRGAAAVIGEHHSAVVILLDDSYSMGCRVGPQTRLARAVDLARDLVAGLRPGDEVTVISFGKSARVVVKPPADRDAILRALGGIRLTSEGTDLESALAAAEAALEASAAREKALVIISDFQKQAWRAQGKGTDRLVAQLDKVGSAARVVLADAGDDGGSNLSLVALECEDPVVARGVGVRLRARVANHSAAEKRLPVELRAAGLPPLTETITVPAGKQVEAAFMLSFPEAGPAAVEVRIPADAVEADNSRWLALEVRDEIKVLAVDGRPSREPFTGQTDFLAAALKPLENPASGRVSPVGLRVMSPAAVEAENFSGEDLVVLAAVPSLPAPAARRLESYVRSGGAVLVFAGPGLDAEALNHEYWRGGEGWLAAPLGAEVKPEQPVGLDLAGSTHPAMRHLQQARYGDAALGRVERYLSLAAEERTARCAVVLACSNGAPYLVERALGQGRTLLCTTTAGADWNDLAARPFYAPLLHELLRYVAGSSPAPVEVGGAWQHALAAEEAGQSARVTLPSGELRTIVVRSAEDGAVGLAFAETSVPGAYAVDLGRGGKLLFAVNVDPRESDLARTSPAELRRQFPAFHFEAAADSRATGALVESALSGRDLSWPLLFLALAAFMLEGLLTWRFSRGGSPAAPTKGN